MAAAGSVSDGRVDEKREARLRHAPPRDLEADELHEAFDRGFLSERMFSFEMRRRSQDARSRLEAAMERYGTVRR